MFESVQALLDEHAALQDELADPALHADAARAKKVNRRYAELSRIVAANSAWQQAQDDVAAARSSCACCSAVWAATIWFSSA